MENYAAAFDRLRRQEITANDDGECGAKRLMAFAPVFPRVMRPAFGPGLAAKKVEATC